VLCAHRDGPRGALAMNALLERRLGGDGNAWYPGRPVLVQRNDAVLKLFNGDIGITLPDASGALMVHFGLPGGGWRALPPLRLPPHETAYAMTVHKAQGSEFDRVLLLLPSAPSRVLTRELVYTALTRAREQAVLCGGEAVLCAAIVNRTQRHSGLLARLRECAQ
jgi:exodeoxyribonuclease V alpha subunit